MEKAWIKLDLFGGLTRSCPTLLLHPCSSRLPSSCASDCLHYSPGFKQKRYALLTIMCKTDPACSCPVPLLLTLAASGCLLPVPAPARRGSHEPGHRDSPGSVPGLARGHPPGGTPLLGPALAQGHQQGPGTTTGLALWTRKTRASACLCSSSLHYQLLHCTECLNSLCNAY